MNEVLTRAEIEAQFDGEWVLVADPELNGSHEVQRGRVVYHGKDREAMYDCAELLQLEKADHLYFGGMPEHIWLSAWKFIGSGD